MAGILVTFLLLTSFYESSRAVISVDQPDSGRLSLYPGEAFNITCKFSGLLTNTSNLKYGIFYNTTDKVNSFSGCNAKTGFAPGEPIEATLSPDAFLPFTDYCTQMTKTDSISLPISFKVKNTMNITCGVAYSPVLAQPFIIHTPLQITLNRAMPQALFMNLTPAHELYSGDNVTVWCSSQNATPASRYKYGIRDTEITNGSFQLVGSYDQQSVWCVDEEHSPYIGIINNITRATKKISLYYIEANVSTNHTYVFSTASSHRLFCDVAMHLPQNVTVTFEWSRNGYQMEVCNRTSITFAFNGTMNEVFSCEVRTNTPRLKGHLAFNVSWEDASNRNDSRDDHIPTAPPETPLGNTEMLAATITLAIIAAIAIALSVLLIFRNRRLQATVKAASYFLKNGGEQSIGTTQKETFPLDDDDRYEEMKTLYATTKPGSP